MTNIMFVHGAAANGKSWFDVPTPFIEEIKNGVKKNNVKVVTLEGHDQLFETEQFDKTLNDKPKSAIAMNDYLKSIDSAMDGLDDWILIGHSMGGMVISQFAADFPKRVKKLIYVTAILPSDGDSVASILELTDHEKFARFMVRVMVEFSSHKNPQIGTTLSSQPWNPLNEPFRSSPEFEDILRHYIYCTEDGVILYSQQKSMVKNAPGGMKNTTEKKLKSDHIPQLTMPEKLVAAIKKGIG